MGLDIAAYRQIRKAAPGEGMHPEWTDEADDTNGYRRMYVNPDFPAQADGIEDGAVYHAPDGDDFYSSGYGRYNDWRNRLALMAHGRTANDLWTAGVRTGPFAELICFSDCEGVIGPRTSAKLAADFAAFQVAADAHGDEDFRAKYGQLRRAFEFAADDGAVVFA